MVDYNDRDGEGYVHDAIRAHRDTPKYLWEGFRDIVGEPPNTKWLERCANHHYYAWDNHHKRAQSWHLPTICTAIGGLSTMMQISVLMGYSEIYLVGADLNYTLEPDKDHFDPQYTNSFNLDEEEKQLYMHGLIARSCPVPIINCTRGGALEKYPRKSLEEVL